MIRINQDGKAELTPQGVNKITDKVKNAVDKKKFEVILRFLYYQYNPESIYKNYLPHEREKKIFEANFTGYRIKEIKETRGFPALERFYVSSLLSFKEKLYYKLLSDIEEMMDRLSDIPLTKKTPVKGIKKIEFVCGSCGTKQEQKVDVNGYMVVDNSEEKIKSMDVLNKLLEREKVLKEEIKKEAVESATKKDSGRRLFDSINN